MAVGIKRPTQARLKKLFAYDSETGIFIRIFVPRPQSARHLGPAGSVNTGGIRRCNGGYRFIHVDGKAYMAHQLAWVYVTGKWPTGGLDHKDGDRDNNRWKNLRLATQAQNTANRRLNSNSKSGVKGVWLVASGKWQAKIGINGVQHNLGRYDKKADATKAYRIAALKHYGEFARTT